MASSDRNGTRDLIAELCDAPERFGLFQAVRLLALAEGGNGERQALPERLRFRTPATLSFPPSEIAAIKAAPGGDGNEGGNEGTLPALTMTVACMGLTGPSGALPSPYTELLIERRQQYRDDTAHAFFDLFSHRALSLFYGAWHKYHFPLAFEQGQRDAFSNGLRALIGLAREDKPGLPPATGNGRQQDDAPPPLSERLLFFAGLLAQRPISAEAIASLVQGMFGVTARLENFVGHWIAVPPEEQTRLGVNAATLGSSAFAGQRIWDRQTRMQLSLGPLRARDYQDFLPGNPAAEELAETLRFCVGHGLACDVRLILDRRDTPSLQLDSHRTSQPRLGFDTWLNHKPFEHDPANAVFALLA